MQGLINIVDSAEQRLTSDVSRETKDYSASINFLNELSQRAMGEYKLEKEVLLQDAIGNFAVGMASVRNVAGANPAGALNFIDEQAKKLTDQITETYGELGGEFTIAANKITVNHKLQFINQEDKAVRQITKKNMNDAGLALVLNSHTIDESMQKDLINRMTEKITPVFGGTEAELFKTNTQFLLDVRKNPTLTPEQPPIITTTDPSSGLNTNIGTNYDSLYTKNPMLLRGFLRIRGLTDAQSESFASQIEQKYPDSPEPAAIRSAMTFRSQSLEQNALEFASNQKYINVTSNNDDALSGETDQRFDNAATVQREFGTTNMFLESERQMLQRMTMPQRVASFLQLQAKVGVYNEKHQEKGIDPRYVSRELQMIDPKAYSWTTIMNVFPDLRTVNPEEVETIMANNANNRQLDSAKTYIDQSLNRVPGIVGFLQRSIIGNKLLQNASVTNLNFNSKDIFSTTDTYAYLKGVRTHGSNFTDAAKIALNSDKKISLFNVDVDRYRVYDAAGKPLLINGKTVEFSGEFLNKTWEKSHEK